MGLENFDENSRTPTIGKNRLLIVFYNGGKEQWTQLLRCRNPQRSVNQ